MRITRIGDGMYRVEHDGGQDIVYVAGPAFARWVFWKGRVFRGDSPDHWTKPEKVRLATESLAAPMPTRVSRILVEPGAAVKKGATVIVLEAMKIELPVRALADATVVAVHCREGELVQAGAVLIDLA